jgi:pimeloyl-ACP methyl ester carboxylesterase
MPIAATEKTVSGPLLRRVLLTFVTAAVLCAVAGISYQSIANSRDRHSYPMPGELVDVGGYKMHIDCMGSGSPVVILDSGLGDSYVSWRKVQPEIAQFTRVCSYDRAGLGYSDFTPHPGTSKEIAQELHALLKRAGVSPPYILCGHSMGGFDVRVYASLYRTEVAGLVLVDASHPEQMKRFPPAVNDLNASDLRQQEFLAAITPFGIPRLLGFCGSDIEVRAAECNFKNALGSVREMRALPESAAQTAASGSLGDLPLAVLSHDPDLPQPDLPEDLVKPLNDVWAQLQNELAGLSTRSTHVVAKNSGHYIQLDRPDLVIAAVHRILERATQRREEKKAP